jgi:hypothetical protein
VATLGILALIVGASYYTALPKLEHIPDKFQFPSESWMNFVPQTAQYVAFVDYHEAYAVSGNPLLFGTQAILQFYELHLDITMQNVLYDLDIQLPQSHFSSVAVTCSVIKIRNDTSRILIEALSEANITKADYDGYPLYRFFLTNPALDQKLISTHMAIVDGSMLVFSMDQSFGRYAVETILDQYSSKMPSLFDRSEVRRGIYAAGASDQLFIGLFVGTFGTQFNNTRMIVKSVIPGSHDIRVTRSVLFANSDLAMNQLGEAHRVYRDANSYRILDQWLVVTYNYTMDKLRGELTGI